MPSTPTDSASPTQNQPQHYPEQSGTPQRYDQRGQDARYPEDDYGDDDDVFEDVPYDGEEEYYDDGDGYDDRRDGDQYYDDDEYYDDGHDAEGDFFEDDFDDDERARKAREVEEKRKKRKPTSVYNVRDEREDATDDDPTKKRDYWGRQQRKCCGGCRNCIVACCRGFSIPPACDVRRFCECPHGWCYTTMGVLLGIGGLVMCSFFIISCDVERIVILYNGVKPPNAPRIGYGFIARGTTFEEAPSYMSCIYYTDQEKAGLFDAWMHAARFFLFLSTALGAIGFVVLFTAICVAWSPNTFEHWLMWNYVFAALAVPMSYMLFGSPLCADNECKLGQGGVQCISIFLFWLTCANTVKSFPTPSPPDESGQEEDTDDLYYETEEDMWNDRRPPPPPPRDDEEDDEPQHLMLGDADPYAHDPEYGEEDYSHGDGADGYAQPDNYDSRSGSEPPATFMEEVPDTDYLDSSGPSPNHGAGSDPYGNVAQGSDKYDDNRMYDNENGGPAYTASDRNAGVDPYVDPQQQVSRPVAPRVGDEDGPIFT